MSAVEISYKGSQIASMDATGVKTLLTGDTFCEDDITVAYTKSGGGGTPVQAQVTSCPFGTYASYVDDEGVFHADEQINPADGWSDTVMRGNLVVLTYRGTTGTSTVVNMILRQTVTCTGRNVDPLKYEIFEVSV